MNSFIPHTIYHKPIKKYYHHLIYLANIRYASKTGNLALLLELKELDRMFHQYGTEIVTSAFKHAPPSVYRRVDISATEPSEKVPRIFGGSISRGSGY